MNIQFPRLFQVHQAQYRRCNFRDACEVVDGAGLDGVLSIQGSVHSVMNDKPLIGHQDPTSGNGSAFDSAQSNAVYGGFGSN